MLLRQALEQTRAGMPPPILFNSRPCDHTDEMSSMVQKDLLDARFHAVRNCATIRSFVRGFAGQLRQAQPHRRPSPCTGAQA
jgi:hypothetical protein